MIDLKAIKNDLKKRNIEVIDIKELYNDYKLTLKDNDVNITRKIKIAKSGVMSEEFYSFLKEHFKLLKELQ